GNDHIDDQKGDEYDEPDLEGGFQLTGDIGRHQYFHRYLIRAFDFSVFGNPGKQSDISFARLAQHKGFEWISCLLHRLDDADLIFREWQIGFRINLVDDGRHDEER